MGKLIPVALGGLIGSSLRYLVTSWAQDRFGSAFPWGTAVVNIVGCFLIGLLLPRGTEYSSLSIAWRLFLVTGLLGGLTTFSSFSFETLRLAQTGHLFTAFSNLAINLIVGLTSVALGMEIGRLL